MENFSAEYRTAIVGTEIQSMKPRLKQQMPSEDRSIASSQASVALLRILRADSHASTQSNSMEMAFDLAVCLDGKQVIECSGKGLRLEEAIANAVSRLSVEPFRIKHHRVLLQQDGQHQCIVAIEETFRDSRNSLREGVGRYVAETVDLGLAVATLRAVNHAGLFKSVYRANNQKTLRIWSRELMEELNEAIGLGSLSELKRLEADSVVLDHFNRVASAAVITASNSPKPESILSLFDTSAWLYDSQGRKRNSFTDTSLWLAWYPGLDAPERIVDSVIATLPTTPASKIPRIVSLFESPTSWCRFRGAVDLEDHDVLHVLLGRGLQDQDEAFVLGFAMGTAKKVSWLQYHIFQFTISRLYPEPYRIPRFLHPAFQLGVKCGQATGVRDLYKRPLKNLKSLSIKEARREAGIDSEVLRQFYRREQLAIPITIASLRLP